VQSPHGGSHGRTAGARGPSAAWRGSATVRIGRNGFGVGSDSGKRMKKGRTRPWQSLAGRAPHLVAELHPTRNVGLDPTKVALAANRRVWWRCRRCGHEWSALVSSRSSGGSGCPRCARRQGAAASSATKRRVTRERSVAALRPDLLELWHPSRNRDLDPATIAAQSSQRVWWRCPACGREWKSTVNNRARARHAVCPTCARRSGAGLGRRRVDGAPA
jgi:rubrerythrin